MNVRALAMLATLVGLIGAGNLVAAEATPAKEFKILPGFKVERLLSVDRARYGSWVSMTVDNKGRLIVSDQGGKLHRLTLAKGSGEPTIETLKVDAGGAHGLLYAFDSLYVMGKSGRKTGLFRLFDTNNDDQFDKIETLRNMPVGSEHGAHAVVLGPDKKSIFICGGNMTRFPTPNFDTTRPPAIWKGDHVIQRMPDARGHNTGALPIGGWVGKIDPDGKNLELICNGFRNEYDIAFNPEGELFTYDSDMEWDIGAAWYRPTRINHLVSGAEFGWRYGTGKWPEYFADSLGSVVDVGPGSPTGITFGTGAKFPAKYQKALFVGDWSYGIIYAVHLTPKGASYTGTVESFTTAAPLAVTDMLIHPGDGAMYFLTGGRNCQSGLYRVTYTGKESTAPVKYKPEGDVKLRALRHKLEALHVDGAKDGAKTAWPYLSHDDRHIRFAARLALEHQPVKSWQEQALNEKNDRARVHALIALARHGNPELKGKMIAALDRIDWKSLKTEEKLELLRAYGLTFARMGAPDEATRKQLAARLDAGFPDNAPLVNRELCRLLSYLDDDKVVGKTLDLLDASPTQEEQMHFAYCLRNVKNGWDLDKRKRYLQWFNKSVGYRGGASFEGFLRNIRKDALAKLTPADKKALGKLADAQFTLSKEPIAAEKRDLVKKWSVAELEPTLNKKKSGYNFQNGRRMFAIAGCFKCHRFSGEGGAVGPDLTGAGGRFSNHDLLESIIEPNKTISDQYQATVFTLKDGRVVTGYVANNFQNKIAVVTNMLEPNKFAQFDATAIDEKAPSPISMMPAALVDILKEEEIADLIAYLRSGGNPDHPLFKK